jgi:hypothetical protein
LLEPQRTNYVRNNTDLTNWFLTASGDTFTLTAGTSPDGTNNAIKLVPGTLNAAHLYYDTLTSQATGGNFVMTCYAKAAGLTKFGLRESQSVGYYATFDLSTGAVIEDDASTTASIVSMGNGWYRCTAVVSASINACIGLVPLPAGYTTGNPLGYSYVGNGTDGVLVYQPQLEVSATYATSPISTAGVASATRLTDAASKTGISSLIGQTEGVLFIDMEFKGYDDLAKWVAFLGTGADYIGIYTNNISKFVTEVATAGTSQFISDSYTFTVGQRYKLALAYKANDFALYINGTQVATDNSGTVPTVGQFDLQYNTTANNLTARTYNQVLLFKTRLSNSDLATLTQL